MSDRIKIASITSDSKPQQGQSHRSSGDFSTEDVPGGFSKFYWEISGVTVPDGISFDVKKDKVGRDHTPFENLTNGSITEIEQDRQLYIANPKGASSSFLVTVYATN
jgi:hypothetical protein